MTSFNLKCIFGFKSKICDKTHSKLQTKNRNNARKAKSLV